MFVTCSGISFGVDFRSVFKLVLARFGKDSKLSVKIFTVLEGSNRKAGPINISDNSMKLNKLSQQAPTL